MLSLIFLFRIFSLNVSTIWRDNARSSSRILTGFTLPLRSASAAIEDSKVFASAHFSALQGSQDSPEETPRQGNWGPTSNFVLVHERFTRNGSGAEISSSHPVSLLFLGATNEKVQRVHENRRFISLRPALRHPQGGPTNSIMHRWCALPSDPRPVLVSWPACLFLLRYLIFVRVRALFPISRMISPV